MLVVRRARKRKKKKKLPSSLVFLFGLEISSLFFGEKRRSYTGSLSRVYERGSPKGETRGVYTPGIG